MAMGIRELAGDRPPAQRASLRVMYGYIRPHRLALVVGALLSLATGATGLVLPLVVRALINDLTMTARPPVGLLRGATVGSGYARQRARKVPVKRV